MKAFRTTIAAAIGLVFLLSGVSVNFGLAEDRIGGNWDRYQDCKIDCNEAYGGYNVFPPPLSGVDALGYSNCVQACDREYWKNFDKQFQDE